MGGDRGGMGRNPELGAQIPGGTQPNPTTPGHLSLIDYFVKAMNLHPMVAADLAANVTKVEDPTPPIANGISIAPNDAVVHLLSSKYKLNPEMAQEYARQVYSGSATGAPELMGEAVVGDTKTRWANFDRWQTANRWMKEGKPVDPETQKYAGEMDAWQRKMMEEDMQRNQLTGAANTEINRLETMSKYGKKDKDGDYDGDE